MLQGQEKVRPAMRMTTMSSLMPWKRPRSLSLYLQTPTSTSQCMFSPHVFSTDSQLKKTLLKSKFLVVTRSCIWAIYNIQVIKVIWVGFMFSLLSNWICYPFDQSTLHFRVCCSYCLSNQIPTDWLFLFQCLTPTEGRAVISAVSTVKCVLMINR